MSTGKIYNFIIVAFLLATGVVGTWLYLTWAKVRDENKERRLVESRLVKYIEKLEHDKEYNSQFYYRLVHDEEFAERVIREKLGYAGKDEIVFRFKVSTPLHLNNSPLPTTVDLTKTTEQKQTKVETKPEQEKAKEVPYEQKSLLRRLFSKEEPKQEKEVVPQIKIDLSKQDKTAQTDSTNTPVKPKEQEKQPDSFKQIQIDDKSPTQPTTTKKSSKKRKRNSIRFSEH